MRILEEIEYTLDTQEIIQLLRNKNTSKNKEPSSQLLLEIEQLKEATQKYIKPKAIYGIFSSENLIPKHLFQLSEKTILAICTISSELEEESNSLINTGELSKGVIVDAIASQAAEEIASQVNKIILTENKELLNSKNHTARFSPGYCRWLVEEGQRLIFNLLPAEKIGVTLTTSSMMIPRKSVSFAINIGENVEEDLGLKDCDTCNLIDCDFRR